MVTPLEEIKQTLDWEAYQEYIYDHWVQDILDDVDPKPDDVDPK